MLSVCLFVGWCFTFAQKFCNFVETAFRKETPMLFAPAELYWNEPPHFPDWFHKLVYASAVVVMLLTVLDWTLCPPCQICVGTRVGQICLEKLPEVKEWFPLVRL